MEEGAAKEQQLSRFGLLALLSGLFWILLLYLYFVVIGGGTADEPALLTNVGYASTNSPSGSVHPAQSTPISKLINVQPTPISRPSNAQPKPISGQSSPISPPSDANSTLVSHPTTTTNYTQKPKAAAAEKFPFPFMRALRTIDNKSDPCGGRYIYVHDLPPRFNDDIIKECKSFVPWADMCKIITNGGLGPPLDNVEGVFSETGWYATNQFAADMIFRNRMEQYECLTNDFSLAAAIFVPFYAGWDITRHLWGHNVSTRDAASLALVDWLVKRPEWSIMGGRDHFLVAGRITWDFRRVGEGESGWGNNFFWLPAAKNMSTLIIESSPWGENDFAIPYPTYFHPDKDADVFMWQDRVRKLERKWLFSFAGAPRPDKPTSIRGQIIDQCKNSKAGKLLECDLGAIKCNSPSIVMKMFQSSLFCLQPPGDSTTRRSTFDSMLAGCIPVFFQPGSAYTQYNWHLPQNYSRYSVFIPEEDIRQRNVSIEQRLSQIPPEQVKIMREEVISLIPRLIYARSKLETLQDAFDVSLQEVIDRVTKLRKDIVDGHTDDDFIEKGHSAVAHERDPSFSKPKGDGVESTD